MGCDYYECVVLCVSYTIKGRESEPKYREEVIQRRPCYIFGTLGGSDGEQPSTEEYVHHTRKTYYKVLYKNGAWTITSQARIDDYVASVTGILGTVEDYTVTKIAKKNYFEVR
jgi:hypothetical protein